ncbi:uncharacterized protein BDW47DRAFT_106169 [Aspergillus candidus]|uniref:Uncharacterized protein n=1 Tax=Aspergillus candidus TaxID=41067 RepID=A0A2I2FBG5_ASPCN|nr:hypothetical protein BDW47DRAFT_106169 [Aspergillus candidus]PLB37972.1 hypothetical protein BDW47DRAFT_106169 [Aspergillus candidus]
MKPLSCSNKSSSSKGLSAAHSVIVIVAVVVVVVVSFFSPLGTGRLGKDTQRNPIHYLGSTNTYSIDYPNLMLSFIPFRGALGWN